MSLIRRQEHEKMIKKMAKQVDEASGYGKGVQQGDPGVL